VINTPLMRLSDELRLRPEQRWLDVGCGRAALLRFIDSRVRFEHPPVGVDFSAEALRIARRDAEASTRPLLLAQGSATALPFADESFDVVTCGYMLKHLTDDELPLFLSEVRRILGGGGVALLWDYAPSGSAALDRWNTSLLGAAVREPRLRSTGTLMRAARAAGYDLVRNARLRPFLFPPMPRASVFIGKAPEGWAPAH
jgi:ubiquinone/menaquinone biosynthesis C-methylase UbiE